MYFMRLDAVIKFKQRFKRLIRCDSISQSLKLNVFNSGQLFGVYLFSSLLNTVSFISNP